MKHRPHIPGIYGLDRVADYDFDGEADELEVQRAARELHRWLNRQNKRVRRVSISIAHDRWWLERFAVLEKWRQEVAKEDQATDRYLESLHAAMKNELQQAWLKKELVDAEQRGLELARELNAEICISERQALEKRQVVRGKRARKQNY